jgi:pimeloyl-[acyl-carrier protein] methyl ester esterase
MQLIFLHALPFDGSMWRAETDLAPSRTLAPTLYKLGDTVEEWAAGVLELAGSEPSIVIGNSVGGSCALEIARLAPEQVAAIVLVGAKAGIRPDPALRDEAVRLLETQGVDAAWARYWAPLFGRNTSAAVVAAARELALRQSVADLVRGVRAFHNRRDSTDWVAQWRRPLVVIQGAEDLTPTPSTAARIVVGEQRRFHLVADCGHYVSLEQAGVFRSLLSDVLQRMTADQHYV